MSYAVKEISKTLQGKGGDIPAVRRSSVASHGAIFGLVESRTEPGLSVGSAIQILWVWMEAVAAVSPIQKLWQRQPRRNGGAAEGRYVVLTGGEPLLQVDALHALGFEIGVETNGTQPVSNGLDWIRLSLKGGAVLVLTSSNELKLVYPWANALPSQYENLNFDRFFLQPMACEEGATYAQLAISYCTDNPRWRPSLQRHKTVRIR